MATRSWFFGFVAAALVCLPVAPHASALAPVSDECLGIGDAPEDHAFAGRPVPGVACAGSVGGTDAADWYRTESESWTGMDIRLCTRTSSFEGVVMEVWWSGPEGMLPGSGPGLQRATISVSGQGCASFDFKSPAASGVDVWSLRFTAAGQGATALSYTLTVGLV